MATVGIKELKDHLTQYLRRTKKGEEIVITERGQPIAVIQSFEQAEARRVEAKLMELAAQGRVTLPTRKPLKRVRRVKVSGRPISETMLEDRR